MLKRIKLADNGKINAFACKWLNKFKSSDFLWIEFEDNFGKDCEALGFIMDCGNSFNAKYSREIQELKERGINIYSNSECLNKIINVVNDVEVLGAAIFSQWRYWTHWHMGSLADTDIDWFIVALDRLAKITE